MRPNWPNSVVSGSRAKIEDIQTLRDEINRVRGVVGLGPISWPPITTMKAADLIEMRDAIQEIWSDNSLNFGSLPPWTDGTPTANTVDPAVHIMDLRTWVSRAGDYPPVQGIDTFSWNQYGAAVDQWAIVNSAWRSNLLGLTPDSGGDAAPLPNRIRSLRCPITAREAALPNQRQPLSGDPNWRSRFQSALSIYTSTSPSLRIYAMFNAETFYNGDPQGNALRSGFIQVNDTFQGQTIVVENTTPFIEDFSTEVAFLVNWLRPLGVNDFIIWNEPNVSEGDEPLKAMSASHYAAMLRRCWRKVMLTTNGWLPISQRPNLCWGGVLFVGVDTENGPVSGSAYLSQIYSDSRAQRDSDAPVFQDPYQTLPWSGINIHLHHIPRADVVQRIVRDQIWPLQIANGDGRIILVGEWGVTRHDLKVDPSDPNKGRGPDALKNALLNIRPWVSAMFYFKHPDYDESRVFDEKKWWGLVNHGLASGPPPDHLTQRVASSDTPQGGAYRDALRTNPP